MTNWPCNRRKRQHSKHYLNGQLLFPVVHLHSTQNKSPPAAPYCNSIPECFLFTPRHRFIPLSACASLPRPPARSFTNLPSRNPNTSRELITRAFRSPPLITRNFIRHVSKIPAEKKKWICSRVNSKTFYIRNWTINVSIMAKRMRFSGKRESLYD